MTTRYSLVPYPTELTPAAGYFIITPATALTIPEGSLFKNEAGQLNELLANSFGKPLPVKTGTKGNGFILKKDATIKSAEGYRIKITKDAITLSANGPAGMFRAIQTIRQLLPPAIEAAYKSPQTNLLLPCVTIADEPAFQWRGLHLDVSRHFFSIAYLKKLIGLMALYKFNKFHLHLTDDQGWRMEIKKYPKLTEEGAWRTFNHQDSVCMERTKDNPDFVIDPKHIRQKNGKTVYGGFYTQAQLKDLVAYAAARHIDIIPEIDMPGHMMAAIDSYNYLSCDGSSAFGKLFSTPICPCLSTTIQFAEDIYTEVMDVFPSTYIHIGGDEVDRSFWEKSAACKELMKKEGLKTAAEVQAWFIKKMEKFFNAHGRKLIGWDEILEGGISPTADIMYWRTWVPNAPLEAARNGNNVIMSPGNPLYFSEPPDSHSLSAVYQYSLIPKNLSDEEAKKIVGAQGNLWTEYVPTEQRADYLYFPRMTALAEKLWTGKDSYPEYLQRMKAHYQRLDLLHVSYRLPDLPLLDNYAFTDHILFAVPKPLNDMTIRYTVDGSLPVAASAALEKDLLINRSQYLRVAAFTKAGRKGDVYNLAITKQALAKAETVSNLSDGLRCIWYKKPFDSTSFISGQPDDTFAVANVVVPKEAQSPAFSLQYRGYIQVPEAGIYTFYLTADDAAVLRIADREVVNNDGMHAPRERNGQVALQKGLQRFALDFIEGGGGYTLKLQYSKDRSAPANVPDSWFKK